MTELKTCCVVLHAPARFGLWYGSVQNIFTDLRYIALHFKCLRMSTKETLYISPIRSPRRHRSCTSSSSSSSSSLLIYSQTLARFILNWQSNCEAFVSAGMSYEQTKDAAADERYNSQHIPRLRFIQTHAYQHLADCFFLWSLFLLPFLTYFLYFISRMLHCSDFRTRKLGAVYRYPDGRDQTWVNYIL